MDNLNTAGERLKRARLLAGLSTRREFEKKYKISANTLQGWEQGKSPLSIKGAKRVAEALKYEGLICSVEWLIHGKGMPPRSYEALHAGVKEATRENDILAEANLREEENIYKETQLFKIQNPNTIVLSVIDDAMSPYFATGDYVGGIQLLEADFKSFINNFCIVELENHVIILRHLQMGSCEGFYTLSCTNHKSTAVPLNIIDVKVICAAPIIWHRKKLISLHNQYNQYKNFTAVSKLR